VNAVRLNPAEEASARALNAVFDCLRSHESFLLEAGAGAGKTYSLVEALRFLIHRDGAALSRRHQRIACVTFTNTAKDEIEARTDRSPVVYCDTVHAFCWSLIGNFQKQLRTLLPTLPKWPERIEEAGGLGEGSIEYTLGYRGIKPDRVSLHHDDVLLLTSALTESAKFRRLLADRYPIILIDEYQDTDLGLVESIKRHFLGQPTASQFGFFGDHWQKIYGNGCGKIAHRSLAVIGKEANFRSVSAIVDCLNRMRPELPQFVRDPGDMGHVTILHSNGWRGTRRTGGHWGGDLPVEIAHLALSQSKEVFTREGWDFTGGMTKILMLTHRSLAEEQGYGTLPSVFSYNDSFTKKEHPHIEFFVDVLEPSFEAFSGRRYGQMFEALGGSDPHLNTPADKKKWFDAMTVLGAARATGTVGDVVDLLRQTRRPRIPDAIEQQERELATFVPSDGEETPRKMLELQSLRAVQYQEIIALRQYLLGYSPFETNHGVKGAEFENVLVVVGRGWNQYNFGEMLELAQGSAAVPANRVAAFERNRNLFYVACSRPKRRLGVVFTQLLSAEAMATVERWFGVDSVRALEL
jgi:DNA helicase II / ATP-dependent DNA helicase PcrA